MLEQGKSLRSPLPEDEGAAETMCVELTITAIPFPCVAVEGKEVENSGIKLNPGRTEE